MELLLDNGAHIDEIANDGVTPLVLSFIRNKPNVSTFLTKRGAKAPDSSSSEQSHILPYHYLINNYSSAVFSPQNVDQLLSLLVDIGAPLHVKDWKGQTPLHLACAFNYVDAVQIILNTKQGKELVNEM